MWLCCWIAELVLMSGGLALKERLQQLDGYDFEHLVADLWADQGWTTHVSQASNDRGVDVEAYRDDPFEQKHLIQAKRYSEGNKIGSEKIQQYASLRYQEENVDAVVIVTTSSYTKQAEEIAADLNLKLVSGDDLVRLIQEQNAGDIVASYISDGSIRAGGPRSKDGSVGSRLPQPVDVDEVSDEYVSDLVDKAMGDLVTENRLTKLKPGITHPKVLSEVPILGHLLKNEQPHFAFCGGKCEYSEDVSGNYNKRLRLSERCYFVVTDLRILLISGKKDGVLGGWDEDVEFTIPFEDVRYVGAETSIWRQNRIELKTHQQKFRLRTEHLPFNESQISGIFDVEREIERCVEYVENIVESEI